MPTSSAYSRREASTMTGRLGLRSSVSIADFQVGAAVYARGIGHWTDAVWHGCVLTGSLTHFIAILVLLLAVQGV